MQVELRFVGAKEKHGATSITRGFGLGQKLPQSFGESLFLCFVSFGRAKEMKRTMANRCKR